MREGGREEVGGPGEVGREEVGVLGEGRREGGREEVGVPGVALLFVCLFVCWCPRMGIPLVRV